MKSVMVDIETLGSDSHAAVISIGLAAFNEDGVIDTLGIAIDPADWHGDITPATIAWWMAQNDQARMYSFNNANKVGDVQAANALREFIARHGGDECWAKGPDFDIVILRHWWERVRPKGTIGNFPIHFRTTRDVRTMLGLAKQYNIMHLLPPESGIAHNPVDDAAYQARQVINIRKVLRV